MEWIFFDVGNVLFNDDPHSFWIYQRAYCKLAERRPNWAFTDMLAEREALAKQHPGALLAHLVAPYLSPGEQKDLLRSIRAEMKAEYDRNHLSSEHLLVMIGELRPRYRLGIIANQPSFCRESLARRGLLEHFDCVAISDELKLEKPDERIFRWALERAGAAPEHCVMVGDRRDNDVEPARRLGMKTIHLDWAGSDTKNWQPEDADARAFLDSVDRVPLFRVPATISNRPHGVARTLGDIPAEVARLVSSSHPPINRAVR